MSRDSVSDCLKGLPRTLKVGAYDWTVCLMDVDTGNCGEADFETRELRLWPGNLTCAAHAVGIVLHECFHVIFDNHGLDKLKRSKDDREEVIVMAFEAGTVSLFRDNPKLLNWMKKWL